MDQNQNRNYRKQGIMIFASLSATIAFFFLLFRFQEIMDFGAVILSALQPLLAGIVLAYVLCPVEKALERQVKRVKGLARFARPVCVLVTVLLALGVLVLFCALILPQLVDSVSGLVKDLPKMLETQLARLNSYLESDNEAAAAVMQMIESAETSLVSWIRTNLFSTVSTVANSLLSIG